MSAPLGQPEIAIFGGSFDPPHLGHVFLAAYALSVPSVELVLVVPVFQHAFGKTLSPFDDRLAMCELAFRDLRRVEVSPLERELGGVSRTLRLIEAVATRYPTHRLRTLIGTDILGESSQWQGFDQVSARAPLLVAMRTGHQADPGATVHGPMLPAISSTEVRAAMARGEAPTDRVPGAVVDYALARGLYRSESAP
jgi:nicotinate-nucleotide adenylyltransferase